MFFILIREGVKLLEIEIKAKVENPEKIKGRLEALGFKFSKKENQEDIYFKSKFQSFEKTGEVLRFRKRGLLSGIITYKGPKVKSRIKIREEIEVIIEDGYEVEKLLKRLGYDPLITVEKIREVFCFEKFSVSLDYVKSLGSFMEIELIIDESQSKSKAEQEVLKLLQKIGIPKNLIEKKLT